MSSSDNFWGNVLEAVLTVVATAAVNQAVNSLLGQNGQKTNTSQTYTMRQSNPAAIIFGGDDSRTAGAFTLYETTDNVFWRCVAVSQGRVDRFLHFWLNDDEVAFTGGDSGHVSTVNGVAGDGRYVDDKVRIECHYGAATETAWADAVSRLPGIWTTDHRGDGVAYCGLQYIKPEAKFVQQAFPYGAPEFACTARAVCYDWRKDSTVAGGSGTQRRNDPTTWASCSNPIVWRVHYETQKWGKSWDRCIAPVLADLTTQANICDESVSLNGGGSELRYRWGGNFPDDTQKDKVRQQLDDACDGWSGIDRLGRLVLKAGKYEAPTVTITDPYIEGITWSKNTPSENRVDRLVISFTDPASAYNTNNCDDWVIDSGPNSQALDLPWVQSWTQARRLAKRKASRLRPGYSGQIKTGAFGFQLLGSRYIGIQSSFHATLTDAVLEVMNAEFDPDTGQFVFDVILANTNIDAWSPATEEGNAPSTVTRVAQSGLTTPTIDSATASFATLTDGSSGAIISITASCPRTDATWTYSFKEHSGGVWTDVPTATSGSSVTLNTVNVPVNASIDVRVSYNVGGGTTSAWSSTTTVDTSTSAIAPATPTDTVASTGGSAGQIDLTWRNPSSSNFDHVVIRRSAASDMSSPTTLASQYGAPGASGALTDTGLTTGTTYYYDFAAANASGALSARTTPVSAVAA